ncbi:hypothetical protein [Streptomyces thinghirensis]|uniref:Uncharacterized protein n=1 Tax=Streptomyces thinghirensis TaxID=551547 RepID=A0ABP9TD28_9ACTN
MRSPPRFRRKQLLVADWLLDIPVPFALHYAPSWGWIVAANVPSASARA